TGVVVVGGGFTGLWTTLALRERSPDVDVVLLEGDFCGAGPSGRNGGFLHGWWSSLGRLRGSFGDAGALDLARVSDRIIPAVRALRAAAVDAGVLVHEQTPVTRVRPAGGGVEVVTASGTIRADAAVVAAGAWMSGWRPIANRVTNMGSWVVLTEPAPDALARIGWTGGEAITDGRTFLHYFRTTPDGRVLMGAGAGRLGYGGTVDARFFADAEAGRRAEAGLR